jgi:serine/threonine-protein kinase HipA
MNRIPVKSSRLRLAPVYDLVTTSVYLPRDSMALTLNGSTRWPAAKELQRLGETRCGGTPSQVRDILERIAEALRSTSADVRTHMKEDPDFADIGERMLREWEEGAAFSLKPA